MCFNCGCGLPNDPMGKKRISDGGGSLTMDDFEKMANDWNMTKEETMKHTLELLKQELGEK